MLLNTVYGVKGEEFKHVLVLDGGWRQCFGAGLGEVARQEEEGRLYYVAMTSAVDQLIVFSLSEGSNPYLVLLGINNYRDIYIYIAAKVKGSLRSLNSIPQI